MSLGLIFFFFIQKFFTFEENREPTETAAGKDW